MSNTFTPALNTEMMAAVEEIKAIRSMTIKFVQTAEARIMERLWTIRKAFPDDSTYGVFVDKHIHIDAKTAIRYAVTWDGARKNRQIRELANAAPDNAMAFVQRLADGGIIDEVASDDGEVSRLLSMPPRKQHQALRELIDTSRAVVEKRHPADKERIKMLEAERDAAVTKLEKSNVVALDSHPAAVANGLVDDLQAVESTLAALAQRAERCLVVDAADVPDTVRDRIVRWGDLASTAIDQIMRSALSGEGTTDE